MADSRLSSPTLLVLPVEIRLIVFTYACEPVPLNEATYLRMCAQTNAITPTATNESRKKDTSKNIAKSQLTKHGLLLVCRQLTPEYLTVVLEQRQVVLKLAMQAWSVAGIAPRVANVRKCRHFSVKIDELGEFTEVVRNVNRAALGNEVERLVLAPLRFFLEQLPEVESFRLKWVDERGRGEDGILKIHREFGWEISKVLKRAPRMTEFRIGYKIVRGVGAETSDTERVFTKKGRMWVVGVLAWKGRIVPRIGF